MTTYTLPFPLTTTPLGGEFGSTLNRAHPHRGHDFSALKGAKGNIHAVTGGVVVKNEYSPILGWLLVVRDHCNKFWGYAHMRDQSLRLVGQPVDTDEVLGVVGQTGSAASADHLHLTLGDTASSIYSGAVQDPIPYILTKQKEQTVGTRTVGNIPSRRRTEPTVADNIGGDPLGAGTTAEIDGWVYDLDPTKMIAGTNKWFKIGKLYSHASTFTDPSSTGLTDLNPVPAGATKAEVTAIVAASEARLSALIAQIPALVVVEQKKPGN